MRLQSRLSLTILTLAALPAVVSAQMGMPGASGVRYGILIGTNLSTISDADEGISAVAGAAVDKKRRVGLGAGIYATIPLAGMVSLQPEAHYDQKGVKYEGNIEDVGQGSLKVNLAYVEVPVLLRLDLAKSSAIHPILFGGASGAFRISCETGVTVAGTSVKTKCDEQTEGEDGEDPIEKYDMSYVGGAGLSLSAMGRTLALQLRYTQGIKSIAKDAVAGEKPKNSTLSILLGIGF